MSTVAPEANRFRVEVRDGTGDGSGGGSGHGSAWSVAIVDPEGRDASVRACRDRAEAETFASTVRQHIGWLSEERFREIYRLDEEG